MKISQNVVIGIVIGLVILLFIVSVSIVPCQNNNKSDNAVLKEEFKTTNNFVTNLEKLKHNFTKKANTASVKMIDQQRQDKVIFDTYKRLNCINRVMNGSSEICPK